MKIFNTKKQQPIARRRTRASIEPRDEKLSSNSSFRRNKTLTGSVSSNVRAAGEKSAQMKSNRTHAHQIVNVRRLVGTILAIMLLASFTIYLLISQVTANVTISLQPQKNIDTTKYSNILSDYYAKHPIERLRFLLNESTLTTFIQAQALEIRSVNVGPSGDFATSQVKLSARQPITSWRINQTKQYVDRAGVAFLLNYYNEPKVVILDKSGVPAKEGEAIASNRFLGFVGLLVGSLQARDYQVQQIVIPPSTTRQIQLKLKGVGYNIKCSIDRPAGEQAEDIDRIVRYLKKKSSSPDYIDVRVEGRAFYR